MDAPVELATSLWLALKLSQSRILKQIALKANTQFGGEPRIYKKQLTVLLKIASGTDALIEVNIWFQSFLLYAFNVVVTPIPTKEYSAENSDELIVTRDNINGLFDGVG